MPAETPTPTELSPADRKVFQTWVEEFDRLWDVGRLGNVSRWLPARDKGPLRFAILAALIRIDLRRQWERGVRVAAESYLMLYPELGTVDTLPAEIVGAEFEVRQRVGPPISWEELSVRFPKQVAALLQADPNEQTRLAARARETDVAGLSEGSTRASPIQLSGAFGRYEIDRPLGKGGMGAVYLAFDTQLKRQVALKVPHRLRKPDPAIIARFVREARAAANLVHPNICSVHDIGEHNGVHYLTMAYIEGESLAKKIDPKRPLPERWVAECVYRLALALDEAHRHGVVHRDLKPSNIMINERGEPVIMDFGLARLFNEAQIPLTQTDVPLGTPAYMAPEHIGGHSGASSPSCDIYSLGVIFYEMLTGRVPYEGPLEAVMSLIVTGDMEPPSKLRRDLDPRLETICLKAMARPVSDRYGSMRDFAAALGSYLERTAPSAADRPSARPGEAEASEADAVFNYTTLLEPSEHPGAIPALPATDGGAQTPVSEEKTPFTDGESPMPEEEPAFDEETPATKDGAEEPPRRSRQWLVAFVGGILLAGLAFFVHSLVNQKPGQPDGGVASTETQVQSLSPIARVPPTETAVSPPQVSPASSKESMGTIAVRPFDAGTDAELRLDGKKMEPGELASLRLTADTHRLQVRGPEIEDIDREFTVEPGNNEPLIIAPVYVGAVRINVPASDVRVSIDDEIRSDVDGPIRLRVGTRSLKVEGPGVVPLPPTFEVRRGQNPPVQVVLQGTLALEFSDAAADVEVRIGGRTFKQKELSQPVPLPVGSHTLRVSSSQHHAHEERVDIVRAANTTRKIELRLREEFQPPPSTIENLLGMKLALIRGGDFTMGSPITEADRLADEAPHPEAIEKHFYLGTHEVTVGQFRAFVDATTVTRAEKHGGAWVLDNESKKLVQRPDCTWKQPGWAQTDAHPVVCVSWHDAQAFCTWLSAKDGKKYRLPSEKEWEHACRAGTTTPFHTGNTLPPGAANFTGAPGAPGTSLGHAAPVGSYAKNAWGLFDMHGNVWEWCADPYRSNPATDKTADTTVRMLRGGSWYDPAKLCRSAYRSYDAPERCYPYVGFRVVCDVPNKQ